MDLVITNVDRTVGTLLGSEISRVRGVGACPRGPSPSPFGDRPARSFGAFVPRV